MIYCYGSKDVAALVVIVAVAATLGSGPSGTAAWLLDKDYVANSANSNLMLAADVLAWANLGFVSSLAIIMYIKSRCSSSSSQTNQTQAFGDEIGWREIATSIFTLGINGPQLYATAKIIHANLNLGFDPNTGQSYASMLPGLIKAFWGLSAIQSE